MGLSSDTPEHLWRERVAKILKSRPFDSLVSRTADGIEVGPLYQQATGRPRAERALHRPWAVLQRLDYASTAAANRQALEDLVGGATGFSLVSRASAGSCGYGLMPPYAISPLFEGVLLNAITLRMEGGDALAQAFAAYVAKEPVDPARLAVSFDLSSPVLLGKLRAQGFAGPFFSADGREAHMAGATEAEELASVLVQLIHYLRTGYEPSILSATLVATQDMFLTLAKFRAVRLLWDRALEAAGLASSPLFLHGETSRLMMAAQDAYTNILRTAAAAFGAGLGGANSLALLPFSVAQGLPNAFARRIARNTQLLLLEESQLWRVSDPAAGAGYVEHLTEALCQKAWALFRRSEEQGGLINFTGQGSNLPVIGVTAHQLAQEPEPAIEAYP